MFPQEDMISRISFQVNFPVKKRSVKPTVRIILFFTSICPESDHTTKQSTVTSTIHQVPGYHFLYMTHTGDVKPY